MNEVAQHQGRLDSRREVRERLPAVSPASLTISMDQPGPKCQVANRGRHGGDPVEQCASDELNREAQAKQVQATRDDGPAIEPFGRLESLAYIHATTRSRDCRCIVRSHSIAARAIRHLKIPRYDRPR